MKWQNKVTNVVVMTQHKISKKMIKRFHSGTILLQLILGTLHQPTLNNDSHLQRKKRKAAFWCTKHRKVVNGNNYAIELEHLQIEMLFGCFNEQHVLYTVGIQIPD